jgi:hypothetical protein
MPRLPDDAIVVHGGQNLPENFIKGTGVVIGSDGLMDGVSVNCAPSATLDTLTMPIASTGYPGLRYGQVGVTTVGKIREAGGDVIASPSETNPNHATLRGLTPEKASDLFRPTVANPARKRKRGGHK